MELLTIGITVWTGRKKKAITAPMEDKHAWSKWRKKALKNGISYFTYRSRIKAGFSPKEAATTPLGEIGNRQHHPFTKEELAEAKGRGIASGTVIARWRNGWGKEKRLLSPHKLNLEENHKGVGNDESSKIV
ncbi:hypothetical protein [Peribacillus loiseleuriae]|uniref:Uncharacterized protein n=1 Tax=Peribacillus loiseleuriae TaxID=1679170 RepID=A0A0K9GSG1_9BACI|nr:hypothetical protein [Peribacillus loiseleuriae]KMY49546.1 hypothetical protein AC625_08305 [Peribacillus loiseleuriae]